MTPQEAAVSSDEKKAIDWLVDKSPRQIQEFLHECRLDGQYQRRASIARIALDIRLAEDAAKSASKLERFTFWLIVLTVVLIAVSLLALVPPFGEMFCHGR